ncbi:hypothetical protein [Sphingobacterium chungjuense]|uniref:hypothetical protein n=1 Tax=Sphingobacterium chungjuense TaxID=2675553 RepID=UPI001407AE1B|nr:hypothetical protein [Sphingobacterium chungjuense]
MTLNQVKLYLKQWFASSPFINTVEVSSKSDYNDKRDVNYPFAHVEYVNNSTSSVYNVYNFVITIADIQNNSLDHRNVDEIHNDCNLLAQDFIDFHSINNEFFEMDENVMINPFDDQNTDRTAGVTFAIRLSVFRTKNNCILPKISSGIILTSDLGDDLTDDKDNNIVLN